jgi:hypothetical protein
MARPSATQRPAARGERRLSHGTNRPTDAAGAQLPEPTWREDVRAAAGLNVLAGIWLIIAPFVLGYGDGDPYWNDIVFGALVAALGATRAVVAVRQSWISSLNVLIGVWIFVSAFWLDDTGRAAWNDVILGAIVFILGIIAWSGRAAQMPTVED